MFTTVRLETEANQANRTIAASIMRMVKFIEALHLLGEKRLDQTCKN